MGSHLTDTGEFQSDKYPTCPAGKVPLSVRDPMAQDLLLEYARRRLAVDAEFSSDLIAALDRAGARVAAGNVLGDTVTMVGFYERNFYCLSNFSAFRVRWDGIDFDTAEHAYQWEKFPGCPEAREQIATARSAHHAFKLARAVWPSRVRADWTDVRVDVMRQILRAKLSQHAYVRQKLEATGTRTLIEDSWRDDFWGWGEHRDGKNMLGVLWMEIRAEVWAVVKCDGEHAGGPCADPRCWHLCPSCGRLDGGCGCGP